MKENIRIKIILIFLLGIIMIYSFSTKVEATTLSVTPSSSSIEEGNTTKVTITGNDLTGKVNISCSGGIKASSSQEWVENNSVTITVTGQNAGNGTITVTAEDPSDSQGNTVNNITKTANIKVTAKNTSNGGGTTSNNNSNTNNNNTNNSGKTTSNNNNNTGNKDTAKYTDVNEKVYASTNVNVRESASTSSKSLGSLIKGQEITRTGKGDNGWSKITFNGKTAYVNSKYLETEKPKTDIYLKSLSIEGIELSPKFSKDVTVYTADISSEVEKIEINAISENEKDKITISGDKNLKEGKNIVTITVKSEEGEEKTYTIEVTKGEGVQNELGLKTLEIEGYELSPEFDSEIYAYIIKIKSENIDKLEINADKLREDSTVEIIGNENIEENSIITIIVKSKDGTETVTYQINVEKETNDLLLKMLSERVNNIEAIRNVYIVAACTMTAFSLFTIILFILRYKTTQKEDKEFYDDNYQEEDYDNYMTSIYNNRFGSEEENETENKEEKYNLFEDETEYKDEKIEKSRKRGKHF